MKKLFSKVLLILMIFSLTFGSTGITMPKATEDKIEEETSVVLESNTDLHETDVEDLADETDETEETVFHDNFLEDNEINGPSYAKNSVENASGVKQITQSTINPIVVLIDFPESEGDASSGKINLNSTYSEDVLSTIESSLSGSSESLKDYVSMVSGGKCVVNPYYAYNINNNVYVYTADHTKEYYMPYSETSNPIGYEYEEKYTRTELLIDAFAAIKEYIPKDLDVDADDDGYIDSVDFFVNYETEWNSFLWPHKWCVFGDVEKTELNGAILGEYNLLTSNHIESDKYKVASHEFMHLLGFPDMYVYNGSGTFKDPVGKWSMMADNTGYPTVWERIRYGGWISENDIPTISQNGIYTIKGSTLDSKKNTIAYKVSIPGSDEFFMIEYREKTANVYEEKIPATGIIVYRVDPNSEGNSSGNPEVYILRNPGYVAFGGYLNGKKGHESFELCLSSGESTGYVVEYLSNTKGQAQFILRKNTIAISSFESSLGSNLKVGDTTDFTINATSKSGSLKYTLDVNGNYLLKDSTSNTVKWAPTEDGTYKITAKAIDNENNITTKTMTIKVTDPNKTVIYYKGYDNPYIHYKVGDGSWTTPPGVQMTSSNDVDGFDYKAEINLKGSETLTACFNDGNGNWDSNSGENYSFEAGYYTFTNGRIRKISKPVPKIAISSFTVNPSSETTVSRFVTLSGEVKNNDGEVTYTYEAKDSTGNVTKIAENTTESSVNWQPQKAGKYTLMITATDAKGNKATSEKEFTVNDTIKLNNVTFNKTSPIYVGEELSATVSFNGGTGKKKCLSIKAQGGNYRFGSREVYFTMNSDSSGTWKPDTDGTYSIMATVQDEAGYITMVSLGTYEVKNKELEITSITSSKGTTIKNGDPTEITINAVGGKGSYTYELYYSLYGSGRTYYILNGASTNKGTFTPNYPQEWTLYAKVTDEEGNTATKQIKITSKDVTSNITTIYYKGYDNPYIHYQIGNGSWTNAPGVKMTACNDVDGYYYKAEIDLGDVTTLTACFNDGNGNWDSNGGQNYSFGTGYYTYSNGVITKIDEPSQISITSSAGDVIKTNTETTLKVNVKGGTNVGYTLSVNGTKLLDNSSSNTVTWKPTKAGIYKISAVATSGSETITAEKTITVKDVTSNITTIYYKGYDNPYIHYQIGNGSWTTAPGVKMVESRNAEGYYYYYKAEIDLGDATTLTACFNDGNGNWDSNNGQNYSFGVGSYTFCNGVITKIDN